MTPVADLDAVVIGGGPAGLSGALNVARAKRSVLLLDANRPRNAATLHTHGYPGMDGVPPRELRHAGRDEVSRYPGLSPRMLSTATSSACGAPAAPAYGKVDTRPGPRLDRWGMV